MVWPDARSLFWAALSLACFWYCRCHLVQVWQRVSSGMGGAVPDSTQIPRSLALFLLSWVLRRFSFLRSGVWFRRLSYSRRVVCLASTSAGVGWTRGFCLALGFLVVALRGLVDFLGFPRRLGSSNGKLSTNICLLGGLIPARAGVHPTTRGVALCWNASPSRPDLGNHLGSSLSWARCFHSCGPQSHSWSWARLAARLWGNQPSPVRKVWGLAVWAFR